MGIIRILSQWYHGRSWRALQHYWLQWSRDEADLQPQRSSIAMISRGLVLKCEIKNHCSESYFEKFTSQCRDSVRGPPSKNKKTRIWFSRCKFYFKNNNSRMPWKLFLLALSKSSPSRRIDICSKKSEGNTIIQTCKVICDLGSLFPH